MTEGQRNAARRRGGKKSAKNPKSRAWVDIRPSGFNTKKFKESLSKTEKGK